MLFINPRSGGGRAGRAQLAEAAREREIEPVVLKPGDDLGALADDAAADGADVLGMAGGDGSLAAWRPLPVPMASRSCAFPPGPGTT